MNRLLSIALAAVTAVSGYIHANLYIDGYRYVHAVGAMFLLQAAGSFAVALLLPFTASPVIRLGAAGLAAGALVGFVLSRTVGVLGFTERGWSPAPQAALTVVAEILALLLLAALVVWNRRQRRQGQEAHPLT